jgi:serine/threonine protein kinase
LKYIHYDALTNFRSKQIGEEQKQRVAIIHRDVKPQNIVFLTRDQK